MENQYLTALNTLSDEIQNVTSDGFSFTVSSATQLPAIDTGGLTYTNFDSKTQSVKQIKTTVLYIDIRKSTLINLENSLDNLAKLYTCFIRGVIKCVELNNGQVRSIIGDRVMVLFDSENCFQNAVRTAILLNTYILYVFNKNFTDIPLKCGIGIDYGDMLVTKVGTIKQGAENSHYKSLVWLGAPANIASKLCDLANKEAKKISYYRYSELTQQIQFLENEEAEFFEAVEPTNNYPMIGRFADPNILGFFRNPFQKNYLPIMMSDAVYNGYKQECPLDGSNIKNLWEKVEIKISGQKLLVYQGDIINVIPGISDSHSSNDFLAMFS